MNKDMLIKRVLSYSSPFPKGASVEGTPGWPIWAHDVS